MLSDGRRLRPSAQIEHLYSDDLQDRQRLVVWSPCRGYSPGSALFRESRAPPTSGSIGGQSSYACAPSLSVGDEAEVGAAKRAGRRRSSTAAPCSRQQCTPTRR